MRYGTISGLAKPVSRLIQGCMMLKVDDEGVGFAILDAAWEQGITAFDNAHVYGGGQSDRVFGRWLAERGYHDQAVVVAKGAHHTADRQRVTPYDVLADIHDSRARMGLDCLDLWCFHRDDPQQPVGPLVEACNQAMADGLIGCWGASNWSVSRLRQAIAYANQHGLAGPVASSPNFSLAEQVDEPWPNCATISGPKHAADRAWYADNGLAVLTWSSLARGFLTGRITRATLEAVKADFEEHTIRCYATQANFDRIERCAELAAAKGVTIPQIALAYVLAQPFDGFALVASYNAEEAAANAAAVAVELSEQECAWLDLRAPALV